jgi:hypothetical protein
LVSWFTGKIAGYEFMDMESADEYKPRFFGRGVEMTELKRCPFCAGEFEYENDTGWNDEYFIEWYECRDCGTKVRTEELVNTRPIEDELNARIKELEASLLDCHELLKMNMDDAAGESL